MSVIPQTNALVGFVVQDENSGYQGKITQVETLPQGMMFTTLGVDPNNPVLIPLVETWITRIDEKTSTIYMELPEGLIELNQSLSTEE
jgi:ribosomal 30S subunit maturation factor RimM